VALGRTGAHGRPQGVKAKIALTSAISAHNAMKLIAFYWRPGLNLPRPPLNPRGRSVVLPEPLARSGDVVSWRSPTLPVP